MAKGHIFVLGSNFEGFKLQSKHILIYMKEEFLVLSVVLQVVETSFQCFLFLPHIYRDYCDGKASAL